MRDPKEVAVQALKRELANAQDNVYRARLAFRGMTPQEMLKEHGNSERSRAEILADYKQWEAEAQEALGWVTEKP